MISTLNHPKLVETSNRYGKKLTKPEEIAIYNRFMSGIDRSDQMVSYYSSPRKTLRWYKKVFFHLLDVAVWNSYYILLYKKYCQKNKKYEFITYRDDLIRKMIDAENLKPTDITHLAKHDNRMKERTNFPESKPGSSRSYSGTGHWPEKIPVREGSKKKSNFLKCKMCWESKKNRKETSFRCKGCPNKTPLCPLCFEGWHGEMVWEWYFTYFAVMLDFCYVFTITFIIKVNWSLIRVVTLIRINISNNVQTYLQLKYHF